MAGVCCGVSYGHCVLELLILVTEKDENGEAVVFLVEMLVVRSSCEDRGEVKEM